MSAPGTRPIVWANGENLFCLAKIGLLLDLEEKCKAPIGVIFSRLGSGTFGINDVREPIRLGLMGGGMSPVDAMTAVRIHVDESPFGLNPSVLVAYTVLQDVMIGVQDDPVGKQDPDPGKAPPAQAGTDSTATTDGSDDPK